MLRASAVRECGFVGEAVPGAFFVSAGCFPAGRVPLRRHHRFVRRRRRSSASSSLLAVFTYRRVRVNEGRLRDRIVLTSLRIAALALVLFCLFRPTLVVRAAVNQQNVVAVLLDDSRSMQIAGLGREAARPISSAQQFGAPDSPLLKSLSDRFLVRVFRFSSSTGRVAGGQGPDVRRRADASGHRRWTARAKSSPVCRCRRGAGVRWRGHQRSLADQRAARDEGRASCRCSRSASAASKLPRDVQIDRVDDAADGAEGRVAAARRRRDATPATPAGR